MERLAIQLLKDDAVKSSAVPTFLKEQMDARRAELHLLQEIACAPSRLEEYVMLIASNRRREVCVMHELLKHADEGDREDVA